MAKAGQHHNDAADSSKPRGHEKSRGRNHPDRSQTITTGTPKKQETYKPQAAEHRDPGRQAQHAEAERNEDIREAPSIQGSTRARESDIGSGESGSQSNASRRTRGN